MRYQYFISFDVNKQMSFVTIKISSSHHRSKDNNSSDETGKYCYTAHIQVAPGDGSNFDSIFNGDARVLRT